MKVMSLKINRDDPTEISVHLDIAAAISTAVGWVFWYGLIFFLGVAVERAYLLALR